MQILGSNLGKFLPNFLCKLLWTYCPLVGLLNVYLYKHKNCNMVHSTVYLYLYTLTPDWRPFPFGQSSVGTEPFTSTYTWLTIGTFCTFLHCFSLTIHIPVVSDPMGDTRYVLQSLTLPSSVWSRRIPGSQPHTIISVLIPEISVNHIHWVPLNTNSTSHPKFL